MTRPNEICRKCEGRTCHEPFQCHGYPQASEQADRIREEAELSGGMDLIQDYRRAKGEIE